MKLMRLLILLFCLICQLALAKENAVVLINPFRIKTSIENEFLSRWSQVAEYMKKQPGFISSKLHKGLKKTGNEISYVNYAQWETSEAFQKAISSNEFLSLTKDFPGEGQPQLYEIVRSINP